MKNMINKSLALCALIIIAVFGTSWVMFGYDEDIGLVFKIVLVSFVIMITQHLLSRISFKYFLCNIVLEYFVICAVVLISGAIFKWFYLSNLWTVFFYVGIVYIISYFLNLAYIKNDVNFINKKLKERDNYYEEKLSK